MTTQPTPGEWEAIPPAKKGKHWKVGAKGRLGGTGVTAGLPVLFFVAQIDNGAPDDTLKTEEANARIMAAAKNLLAACEKMLARHKQALSIRKGLVGYAGGKLAEEIAEAEAALAKAKGEEYPPST